MVFSGRSCVCSGPVMRIAAWAEFYPSLEPVWMQLSPRRAQINTHAHTHNCINHKSCKEKKKKKKGYCEELAAKPDVFWSTLAVHTQSKHCCGERTALAQLGCPAGLDPLQQSNQIRPTPLPVRKVMTLPS